MILPGKHVEVAIAIVFGAAGSSERLLICKRKADAVLGGLWEFPGGKVFPGEALDDCARREVREEVGIEVEIVRQLPVIEHAYDHAFVRLHPFVCRHVSGEVELLAVADARWILPGEIGDYRFPAANAELVADAAGGLARLLAIS